jgi:hypothetical protein
MLYTVEFQYSLVGAVVTGDTYTIPAAGLPKNSFRISEVAFISVPLDTNATPTATISVGDAGSATRFINVAPAGVNGITTAGFQLVNTINVVQGLTAGVVSSGTNYLYDTGTAPVLVATVGGTVATAATTGLIRLRVTYYCTEEN